MEEQAVIVRFNNLADNLDPLFELEDELETKVIEADVGEFDGHEIAVDMSDGSLYMYGPDANAIFDAVRSSLAAANCIANVKATLRFGPPKYGVPERLVVVKE